MKTDSSTIGLQSLFPGLEAWQDMHPQSRVWVYASDRPFTAQELATVVPHLEEFARQWASHNIQLKSWAGILFDQFVVLIVDETRKDASGCSIDTSVRYLQGLQDQLGINLFDRWNFHFMEDQQVVTLTKDQFAEAYRKGRINDETLVFDHLVNTLEKLQNDWIKPVAHSWHQRFV